MKKFIKISLVLMSLTVQVAPALAGAKDYKPGHAGFPGALPPASTVLSRVKGQAPMSDAFRPGARVLSVANAPISMSHHEMRDPLSVIGSYLDPVSLARFSQTQRNAREAVKIVQASAIKRELSKVNLLTLPEVTQADVAHLQQAGVQTSIRAPLRSFKISDTPITIGLYHAVMGHYPDLGRSDYPTDLNARNALRARWQANPDLPLTNTTVAEDQAFIAALNARTGRHFRLPTESEVEYSIRGRAQGAITTTRYHFGDDAGEVRNRAWIHSNSGKQAHGVREPLPGRTLEDSKNSFGLIHATGNVLIRSAEGVARGGSFICDEANERSSNWSGGWLSFRGDHIGVRLVEDL